MKLSFYLSGTMQGSKKDTSITEQDYRQILREIILKTYPSSEIICPRDLFQNVSPNDTETIKLIIPKCVEVSRNCDIVIAYLPEASMGSAVELWEAHKNSKTVLVITTMRHNAMILSIADKIFNDFSDLDTFLQNTEVESLVTKEF